MQKLIQQLNEASSLSIEDIKKVLAKDKYGKIILKKDASLADVDDKEKFLATIKYYLLNNHNVLAFVNSRNNIKDLFTGFVRDVRQIKAANLGDKEFANIKDVVDAIFKENASVSRGTLSASARKEVVDWVNGNNGYHNLSQGTMKELKSIEILRSNKPVRLYRGLLFKKYSLESREQYDGTLDKGNGLKFLDSIRANGKEVDLVWDRASSWTTSKEVADRFAKYASADSNYGAMLNALSRGTNFIDGDLGFVISVLAKPEDVLLDVSKLSLSRAKHDGEAEFILAPGKYHCKINNRYTVTGEVPLEADKTDVLQKNHDYAAEKAAQLKKKYSLEQFDKLSEETDWSIFRNTSLIKKLASNETTDLCTHAYEAYLDLYKTLAEKDFDHTQTNNSDLIEKIKRVKRIHSHFEDKSTHSKSQKGEKVHTLSYPEYRATMMPFYDMKYLEKEIMVNRRVTKDSLDSFKKLAQFGDIRLSDNFWKLGAANQKEDIQKVINTFLNKLNIDVSDEFEVNAKTAINLYKRIARNYATIKKLRYFQDAL